ncbi:PREDICTED: uncharacterized protein LOC107342108 [Acropora digitifera]|uniref:uncharacterized protein LOC107342108 n=1 Tax=Acropora digitifera TaxID=70779 RepID=UPI00077A89EA|nr:PREDICTED: uncharacterized protein LOC107342108 [Acropora digitifera]
MAVKMMKPGCFMASIDLKDAYCTVPIFHAHQKYLKFIYNGTLYQYTCMANGLSCAPRVFTKLLKPVYATLHNLGYLSLGYIDDSYLQGDTSSECLENVKVTASLFKKVGFHLHPTKSVIIPTQRLTFLGFVLDSNDMTVTPTESKIQKVVTACQHLLPKPHPTITEVAEVIGLLVSNFPGAQYGPLHYRSVESDKIQALKINKGNYKSHMQLTSSSIADLKWWIANMPTVQRDIVRCNPSMVIQTDASKKGWGAALGNQEIGGRWTDVETTSHINILELQAAFFALRAFCHTTNNTHVQLQIDNTTAVAYITNMGGTKSTQLNNLAKEMWTWCINKNIWLSAVHIAGKLNTSTDNKSRNFSDKHEWALSKEYFQEIVSVYPELNIDLFASRLNNQLDVYCSWKPDPGCTYVDAFSIDWSNFNFFAFPPFSLIPRCVQKISQDKAKGILLIPVWPTQTWFPLVLQLLYSQPWIFKPSANLLCHAHFREPHPLHKSLHLMVCPLSGTPSYSKTFLLTLPPSSWPPGGKELKTSTKPMWKNGWHFVVKGKSITVLPR